MSEIMKQTESASPTKIKTSQTKITGTKKQIKKGAMAGFQLVNEVQKLT
jgi:hypothetical protein